MKAFRIGRSRKSDVVIADKTVSRAHAELVATEDGKYHLTDCKSTGGTYRTKNGAWVPIRQAFLAPDEPIMLGEYRTTARALAGALPIEKRKLMIPAEELKLVEALLVRKLPRDDLPCGPVERDPETGEVIRSAR